MPDQRNNALTELKHLVENLKKCKLVLSDRIWKEELDQICIWANNEGTTSSLPEINKRTNDIKLKVRDQIIIFCFFLKLK